mgnify:CR=1 FL=1
MLGIISAPQDMADGDTALPDIAAQITNFFRRGTGWKLPNNGGRGWFISLRVNPFIPIQVVIFAPKFGTIYAFSVKFVTPGILAACLP